jgi:hypothetical protein
MNETKTKMWKVVSYQPYTWSSETEHASREEAEAELAAMRERAEARTRENEAWLKEHPKPWSEDERWRASYLNVEGQTPLERFEELRWRVVEIEATPKVWRLNTLPHQDPETMKEIETKVRLLGRAELGWTCTGHTRAAWQTQAAAADLRAAHPEWEITTDCDTVYVKGARG